MFLNKRRAWNSDIPQEQTFPSLFGTRKAVKPARDFTEERIKVEV